MQSGISDEFNVQERAEFHIYREISPYTVPFCTIKFFCLITPKKKKIRKCHFFQVMYVRTPRPLSYTIISLLKYFILHELSGKKFHTKVGIQLGLTTYEFKFEGKNFKI